jgi:hypothetical protein
MKRLCMTIAAIAVLCAVNCAIFGMKKKPTTFECERAKRVCNEAERYKRANREWGVYNSDIEERQKLADFECEQAKTECEKSLRELQMRPREE